MALIKKIRTKDVIGEHLIVDGAGSILPLSRVTAATVTINNASVASAEEVVWLNNIDHKQFVAVSGGQYYKDWTEFTYGGITYPPSSIYADKKAKALFRVGKSLMQFSTTDNAFVYILEDDLAQITEDAHNYTDQKIANLVNGAPDKLNTLDELAAALKDNENIVDTLNEAIGNKVSKVEGKGLSTNDYTTAEKNKVAGIGAGATIEANFNSANVPYNVVLPFSGIITDNITVANTSANNPNGIYWSNSANKFVARAGTTSFTYHSTWASFSDLSNETYPASAYYHRADAKGKLYLKGNVSYAFVAGSLIPVGDGVGGNIDLSNYYTKAQADTNFIKKNGQYVNIGNYVAIGDIEADSEFDAVAIYPGVGIEIGAKYNDNGFEEFSLYKMGYPGIDFALGNKRTKIGQNVIIRSDANIGNYVTIGDIDTDNEEHAVEIGTNVNIKHGVSIGQDSVIGKNVRVNLADYTYAKGIRINRKDVDDPDSINIGKYYDQGFLVIGTEISDINVDLAKHALPALVFGKNVILGSNTIVGEDVSLGKFVSIGKGVTIEDGVTIGSGVNIGDGMGVFFDRINEEFRLSDVDNIYAAHIGKYFEAFANVKIGTDTSVGSYVSIGSGVTIGEEAYVAGSFRALSGITISTDTANTAVELFWSGIGSISIGDSANIGKGAAIGDNCSLTYSNGKMILGYSGDGVYLGTAMSLSLEREGTTSYLVIKDSKNNNAVGKIAFVNGDVISTSVVSGDTLAV